MSVPTLRLAPADQGELAQEFDSNLQYGRAFAKEAEGVEVLADCVLTVVHPDSCSEIRLPAQVVMVTDAGVGIELRPFDETIRERLRSFVSGTQGQATLDDEASATPEDRQTDEDAAASDAQSEDAGRLDAAASDAQSEAQETATQGEETVAEARDREDEDEHQDEHGNTDEDEPQAAVPTAPDSDGRQSQRPRHEQLRHLNSTQQHKLARKGELNDRVILERLYGKNVWEPLLHNPRLTVPEVARIARKGTVPRPLLELIADNNSWIQASVVRRALLGNPRVNGEAIIMKLLRITPKHELKTIAKTSTYSGQVREAAKKLLG